jgi:hypothetical protein
VHAARNAANRGFGQGLGERLDKGITPPAIAHAHASPVLVELAALEEVGERALLDAGDSPVGDDLLAFAMAR